MCSLFCILRSGCLLQKQEVLPLLCERCTHTPKKTLYHFKSFFPLPPPQVIVLVVPRPFPSLSFRQMGGEHRVLEEATRPCACALQVKGAGNVVIAKAIIAIVTLPMEIEASAQWPHVTKRTRFAFVAKPLLKVPTRAGNIGAMQVSASIAIFALVVLALRRHPFSPQSVFLPSPANGSFPRFFPTAGE